MYSEEYNSIINQLATYVIQKLSLDDADYFVVCNDCEDKAPMPDMKLAKMECRLIPYCLEVVDEVVDMWDDKDN